jgi:hypothetical protein
MQVGGWLYLAVLGLAACGGSSKSTTDAAVDDSDTSVDAASDSGGGSADAASGDGTLTLTLSNASGANAQTTELVVPNLQVGIYGMTCNSTTAPTSCSFHVADSTSGVTVEIQSYISLSSFDDDTSEPLISAISPTTGTAIAFYKEGSKRWDAGSGTFTLDHHDGAVVSFHINGAMSPNGSSPGGATGTFTLDATAQTVRFATP